MFEIMREFDHIGENGQSVSRFVVYRMMPDGVTIAQQVGTAMSLEDARLIAEGMVS